MVVGNESMGVSEEIINLADEKIGIKSKGIVPCLNVSNFVAFIIGISLRELIKSEQKEPR